MAKVKYRSELSLLGEISIKSIEKKGQIQGKCAEWGQCPSIWRHIVKPPSSWRPLLEIKLQLNFLKTSSNFRYSFGLIIPMSQFLVQKVWYHYRQNPNSGLTAYHLYLTLLRCEDYVFTYQIQGLGKLGGFQEGWHSGSSDPGLVSPSSLCQHWASWPVRWLAGPKHSGKGGLWEMSRW